MGPERPARRSAVSSLTRLPIVHSVQLTSSEVAAACYPAAAMPSDRTDADERAARIGVLLDDLHLTAEDLTELVKQAVRRVLQPSNRPAPPPLRNPDGP